MLRLTPRLASSLLGELSKLAAKEEFAPGLPDPSKFSKLPKVKKPQMWEVALQEHIGERAGKHYDLRLGNPATGVAHSWAVRKGLPTSAQSNYHIGIQQPDHTIPYMDFEGEIPTGSYGGGPVKLSLREQAEVYHSDPKKVKFNVYTGKGPEEFVARQVGSNELKSLVRKGAVSENVNPARVWAIHNVTRHQNTMQLPLNKPDYKEIKAADDKKVGKLFADPDTVIMPKLDGAHNLVRLELGKVPRVYSYREPKTERPGGVIEHTHKIPDIVTKKVPPGLGNIVLRGETVGIRKSDGRAIPAAEVGGLLNSSVLKSREEQQKRGVELRQSIFDVAQYRGKDATNLPFAKKIDILKRVSKVLPHLFMPEMVSDPGEAQKMLTDIKAGKNKLTREGVVVQRLSGGPPTKVKFVTDKDVYVREVFGEKGNREGMAGGFKYSLAPDGPIIGRVGSGLDFSTKKDMLENPHLYLGRAAKVIAEKQSAGGALQKPRFSEWHADKGMQPMVV